MGEEPVNRLCPGWVGKTWEPGAFEELLGDVSSEIFGVYGGDTTLGAEQPRLKEWRAAQRT